MKKINLKENQVLLSLDKPYYRDYLKEIFKDVDGDALKINRRHDLGALIYANYTPSQVPPPLKAFSEYTIKVSLPDTGYDNYDQNFICLTKAATVRINSAIKAYFNFDFRDFVKLSDKLKEPRNKVIRAFLESMLDDTEFISEDGLKKKDYRTRKNLETICKASL